MYISPLNDHQLQESKTMYDPFSFEENLFTNLKYCLIDVPSNAHTKDLYLLFKKNVYDIWKTPTGYSFTIPDINLTIWNSAFDTPWYGSLQWDQLLKLWNDLLIGKYTEWMLETLDTVYNRTLKQKQILMNSPNIQPFYSVLVYTGRNKLSGIKSTISPKITSR